MTKCPMCHTEIDHLLFWATVDLMWKFGSGKLFDRQTVEESICLLSGAHAAKSNGLSRDDSGRTHGRT